MCCDISPSIPSLSLRFCPTPIPSVFTYPLFLLQVAVHYPRAIHQYNETQQAMREEQYYRIETDLQYEKQMLTYVTNLTQLNNSTLPAVTISWGGRRTEPIEFHEINVTEIGRLLSVAVVHSNIPTSPDTELYGISSCYCNALE